MRDHRGHKTIDDERELMQREVDDYLEASYRAGSRATTSEFARRYLTDPATLSRKFRRLFGTTPLWYFRTRQLLYAAELLRESPMTTDEITVNAALGTRSTFFRRFVWWFGVTPDEYRRNG